MKTCPKKTILGSQKKFRQVQNKGNKPNYSHQQEPGIQEKPRRWSLFKKAYQPGMAICINTH
jgi:hypothetical protein